MASLPEKMFKRITAVTTAQLLKKSKGFVIPAFQRDFSWKKEHFKRFFEDVTSDLNRSASGTFMGGIICTQDIEALDVQLDQTPHAPTDVWQVVDGQQRLSFLALLATVIHERISSSELDVANKQIEEAAGRMSIKLLDLISTPLDDRKSTLNSKIIREYDDCWSNNIKGTSFRSPVARMLTKYIYHATNKEKPKKFKYDIPSKEHGNPEEHRSLVSHRGAIGKLLDATYGDGQLDVNLILQNKELLAEIFEVDTAALKANEFEDINDDGRKVLCFLALGHYILENIYFINIPMRTSLDDAFLVFDALNTTGCTLNAYETFRPEVIKRNGQYFNDSSDKAFLDEIDKDIRSVSMGKREQHVNEMIIAFASANSGSNPGKKIREQRKYLRESYREAGDDETSDYLHLFAAAGRMLGINYHDKKVDDYVASWHASLGQNEKLKDLASKAKFCLDYLHDAGFSVTSALFTRFLHHMHCENFSPSSIEMFCRCILKTTAFFTLWRSSRETTDSIDSLFRDNIMEAFSRDAWEGKPLTPDSIGDLGQQYIKILQKDGKLSDLTWKKRTREIDIYRMKQVTKFILLVGTHKTVVRLDGSKNPFLEVVHDGIDIITADGFRRLAFASIEHITPQSTGQENVHQLGNLTLLPGGINSVLKDKPWAEKKLYYQALSSQTISEEQKIIKDIENALEKQGQTISKKFKEFLERKEGRYLHMTKFLGMIPDKAFDSSQGKIQRTTDVLDNCWDILAQDWLDWPGKAD